MSVVAEQGGELYALLVDQVAEVMSLPASAFERNPPTLPPNWAEHCQGVYRLEDRLLVVLDVARLLRCRGAGLSARWRATCLVVDDSRVVRKVARRILEAHGFTVTEAEDGPEALDACRAALPDCVLLDWNMPVMNGLEFLQGAARRVRSRPSGGPVLHHRDRHVASSTRRSRHGAQEFIMKPFDADILLGKFAAGRAAVTAARAVVPSASRARDDLRRFRGDPRRHRPHAGERSGDPRGRARRQRPATRSRACAGPRST